MTTICLTEEMIALLDNLEAPLDFCDGCGHLLGTFIPETEAPEAQPAPRAEGNLHVVYEQLGPEMGIYGFEADLE